jgi:hypothetical protein
MSTAWKPSHSLSKLAEVDNVCPSGAFETSESSGFEFRGGGGGGSGGCLVVVFVVFCRHGITLVVAVFDPKALKLVHQFVRLLLLIACHGFWLASPEKKKIYIFDDFKKSEKEMC